MKPAVEVSSWRRSSNLRVALLVLGMSLTAPCVGMEFYFGKLPGGAAAEEGWIMTGEINRGDSEKLLGLIRGDPENALVTPGAFLDSPGGDVIEAIKIASVTKNLYLNMFVAPGQQCVSACFFVFLSGKNRYAGGRVGIHRAYFDPVYVAGLDLKNAEARYKTLWNSVESYLREQRVPTYLRDILQSTPSTSIYWLTPRDFGELGESPAWYAELVTARCGRQPDVKCRTNVYLAEKRAEIERLVSGRRKE